jgi:hypothetical protein
MTSHARPGSTTSVEVMLNTLTHERHTRGALLGAFASELRTALSERAPESTRDLLARAQRGELPEVEVNVLLDELRGLFRTAA